MKLVVVFILGAVFEGGERLAKRNKKSRSQLSSGPIREYVARHIADEVTESMNKVCDQLGDDLLDPFVSRAGQRILESTEW